MIMASKKLKDLFSQVNRKLRLKLQIEFQQKQDFQRKSFTSENFVQ